MRRTTPVALTSLLILILSGCDQTELAYGDFNSIILATYPETWEAVQDSVYAALEPSMITTVRNEEIFTVTYQDPSQPEWGNLRKFRQMLLLGTAEEPWMAEAVSEYEGEGAPTGVFQVRDLWVRNQIATVLVLESPDDVESILEILPQLRDQYLAQYREWATNRMFLSGRDTALADTLRSVGRFSLLLPEVYVWDHRDSIFLFRNDNPDPSELIRQFMVTWRSPMPESLSRDSLLAWRNALANQNYTEPQVLDTTLAREESFEHQGLPAYRYQATWQNTPEAGWPAAGPLIVQTVECPAQDRLYLLDAWLYAPGRDKFEYMTQLHTILDSFRCGT